MWPHTSKPIVQKQQIPPPKAPFSTYIFGVGLVEASSGNIYIGSPVSRIVEKVLVTVGQRVKKGLCSAAFRRPRSRGGSHDPPNRV